MDNLTAAAAIYNSLYALPEEQGGGVCATFQIVSLSGWVRVLLFCDDDADARGDVLLPTARCCVIVLCAQVPDASQPKAKTRGSAGVSLKDLVEL